MENVLALEILPYDLLLNIVEITQNRELCAMITRLVTQNDRNKIYNKVNKMVAQY